MLVAAATMAATGIEGFRRWTAMPRGKSVSLRTADGGSIMGTVVDSVLQADGTMRYDVLDHKSGTVICGAHQKHLSVLAI